MSVSNFPQRATPTGTFLTEHKHLCLILLQQAVTFTFSCITFLEGSVDTKYALAGGGWSQTPGEVKNLGTNPKGNLCSLHTILQQNLSINSMKS